MTRGRIPLGGLILVLGSTLFAAPQRVAAQGTDSVLARIQQLVIGSGRAEARVLADSLLKELPPLDSHYPEVLYWRAFSSSNAADAERDYLRLSVEYPLSPRAPDALLALAQLEYARGDRSAARRRYDRLLRDYPSGNHVATASYWSGRLAMDEGDPVAACASLNAAREAVAPGNIELRNQIDYLLGQCAIPLATPTDSTAGAAGGGAAEAESPAREWSIQVAAYSARRDATSMASRLKARGFDVRVVGTRAPYRVRIGRYATRALATAALNRVRSSFPDGIVVEAEPR
jgi:SPOR domain/Tetratricopeptide repeat